MAAIRRTRIPIPQSRACTWRHVTQYTVRREGREGQERAEGQRGAERDRGAERGKRGAERGREGQSDRPSPAATPTVDPRVPHEQH